MRFTCIALAAVALALVKPLRAPGLAAGNSYNSYALSAAAPAPVHPASATSASNGVIDFTPLPAEDESVGDATLGTALVPGSDTTRCVTVTHTEREAKLVVAGCSPDAAQSFAVVGGEIRAAADMCVTAPDSRDNAVRPVSLEPCDGSAAQRWTATDAGEFRGYRGKCLTAAAGLPRRDGTPLAVRACMGRSDQQWEQRALATRRGRVESIRVNAVALSLTAGRTSKVNAMAIDGDGQEMSDEVVSWTSSDPAVATVSPAGLVTAVGGGSTTVVASAQGRAKSVAVEVRGAQYAGVESGTATFGADRH
jgi:hypothetical protein